MVFSKVLEVNIPDEIYEGEGFDIVLVADGEIPFPQAIIYQDNNHEWIVKDDLISIEDQNVYRLRIPAESYHAGQINLKIEGCKKYDISIAGADDWVTVYRELNAGKRQPQQDPQEISEKEKEELEKAETKVLPQIEIGATNEPVIYFGIHKHMHQPYYNATDISYWDGEKDEIFGTRSGPYNHFIPSAAWQYINGGLVHAGLSTSWSGSLIEQLDRAEEQGLCGGAFTGWKNNLRKISGEKTAFGNPRVDFTAFGFFHPLMPLVPDRDIIGQIEWHRGIIKSAFGADASDILFPPETAFHPHMIPALNKAGIKAVIYDSIHHFRACKDYPYAGLAEGMLPPNEAEQENFPVDDWLQLNCIWAPSKISPSLLTPCILCYTDQTGQRHKIIGIPAERYLGNEDARGGYGALQYEMVMGQIYDQMIATGSYNPEHPPFFLLHSDGDNHGGGAESYYTSNTSGLVNMCQNNPKFQLISAQDYLNKFPVDPSNIVHVEPGAWAGADNGDHLFTKWFSWAEKDYSPDLNSWAVLTAFQNIVHSIEDNDGDKSLVDQLKRLLYTAETSCYWYWTGQDVWDGQVTNALNMAYDMAKSAVDGIISSGKDTTGPTIFSPWVRPANPGGKDWGNNCLVDAEKDAHIKTFIYDISEIESVTLHYQEVGGSSYEIEMENHGAYPSRTSPAAVAGFYSAIIPEGTGNIRYYIEAIDKKGNVSQSHFERVFIN